MTMTAERGSPDAEADLEELRRCVFNLAEGAFTRQDLEAARNALQEHYNQYPQDRGREFGHGMPRRFEYLEEREAESKRLGLTSSQHEEREELLRDVREGIRGIDQVSDPDAIDRYESAKAHLESWLIRYPGDREALSRIKSLDKEIELTRIIRDVFENDTDENAQAAAEKIQKLYNL